MTHGVLNHEEHEDHEGRPSDGPPQAACCDGRERKYKPLITKTARLVFAFPSVAAAGVLRTPANRTAASVRLRASVPPCKNRYLRHLRYLRYLHA